MESFTSQKSGHDIFVVPDATNGIPRVLLIIKKRALTDVLLDGDPAVIVGLSEQSPGTGNAPWELGSLLAEQWELAKKKALAP